MAIASSVVVHVWKRLGDLGPILDTSDVGTTVDLWEWWGLVQGVTAPPPPPYTLGLLFSFQCTV